MDLKPGSTAYVAVHKAISEVYGNATEHVCVDCGQQAYDWSHIHGQDPWNLKSYTPRCRSCHRKYDVTPEFRQKMSDLMQGNKRRLGIKHTPETLAKLKTRNPRKGESHGRHKLAEYEVVAIRELWGTKELYQREIGAIFGVSQGVVQKIIARQLWSHVD